MNPNIEIRLALEVDYKSVERFARSLHELDCKYTDGLYKKKPRRVLWKGTYLNILDSDDESYWIAEKEGKIIGVIYSILNKIEEDEQTKPMLEIEIGWLYVKPKYRREGVATSLINMVKVWGKEKGAERLTVLAYGKARSANKLYIDLGFNVRSIKYESLIN